MFMKRFGSIVLFLIIFFYQSNLFSKQTYIAHAGGSYDGLIYTNSINAIKASLSKNYKYIEIDLMLSSDNFFFGLHSWNDLEKINSLDQLRIAKLKRKHQLNKLKINDIENFNKNSKIGIITEKSLIKILENNPEVTIITDKTQNFDKLENLSKILKNNIYVEISNKQNYLKSLFYDLDKRLFYSNLNKIDQIFIKLLNIKDVIVSKKLFSDEKKKSFINKFVKNKKINFYIFTINEQSEVNTFNDIGKFYIYTDFLKPHD